MTGLILLSPHETLSFRFLPYTSVGQGVQAEVPDHPTSARLLYPRLGTLLERISQTVIDDATV
jgi:hypothetical protein